MGPEPPSTRRTTRSADNVLIAYECGTFDRSALDHDELAIAAITFTEYRVGIELADTAESAATRARTPRHPGHRRPVVASDIVWHAVWRAGRPSGSHGRFDL